MSTSLGIYRWFKDAKLPISRIIRPLTQTYGHLLLKDDVSNTLMAGSGNSNRTDDLTHT